MGGGAMHPAVKIALKPNLSGLIQQSEVRSALKNFGLRQVRFLRGNWTFAFKHKGSHWLIWLN
jgi:hypothetical protein